MDDHIFPPTQWSAVLQAADGEPDQARRAFERLCAEYRNAIAHWMRLQRLTPEDAEDAAHDFLAQWLHRENPLQGFQRGERRFREFLRVCLRRFLADWLARRRAARRGGGAEHVPLEPEDWSEDGTASCLHLDFALATQTHQSVLARLQAQWQTKLPVNGFDRLCGVALETADNPGYAALASELSASVGTVKSWVFRLRREYHEGLRAAVSRQTDPALIDEEVLYLHGLLLHPPSEASQKSFPSVQPPPAPSR